MSSVRQPLYRGVLVSGDQYNDYGSKIFQKNVIRITRSMVGNLERQFFSLGALGYNLVIDPQRLAEDLINSGLILDVTNMNYACKDDFIRDLRFRLYDDSERIRRCNYLRNLLMNKMVAYRNCAPEYETLLNPEIAILAKEHVGLFDDGAWIGTAGINFSPPDGRPCPADRFWRFIDSQNWDSGQKKLFSLFCGFVLDRDVVYVGSSPGTGWQWAKKMLKWERNVISIDPRDLEAVCETGITHYKKEIHSNKDLLELPLPNNYDLIWDVRGDWESHDQYHELVEKEIVELHDVLSNLDGCRRVCIKISAAHVTSYLLPPGGRFYYLPWCKDRKVAELRYVARYSRDLKRCDSIVSDAVFNHFYAVKSDELVSDEWIDFSQDTRGCFYNSMLMRFDYGNYMVTDRLPDSLRDLNLFSINRNTPEQTLRYFDKYWTDGSLVSYFSKEFLDDGEFEFEEIKILSPSKHTVILPRVIIKYEIPGLYLVVPFDERWHFDEVMNSESYKIMACMEYLSSYLTRWDYEEAKAEGAKSVGEMFVRFPASWSVMDSLMTPSGHMLRMTYMHLSHYPEYVSLFLFLGKIFANFSRCRGRSLPRFESLFRCIGGNCLVRHVESKFGDNWHSMNEWMAGYVAGCSIAQAEPDVRFIDEIKSFVHNGSIGKEVSLWRKNIGYRQWRTLLSKNLPGISEKADVKNLDSVISAVSCDKDMLEFESDQLPLRILDKGGCDQHILSLIRDFKIDYLARLSFIRTSIVITIVPKCVKVTFVTTMTWNEIAHHVAGVPYEHRWDDNNLDEPNVYWKIAECWRENPRYETLCPYMDHWLASAMSKKWNIPLHDVSRFILERYRKEDIFLMSDAESLCRRLVGNLMIDAP